MKRLTCLIHADTGQGKSWLGDTAPGPRLLLDAEGRAEYTLSPKVYWNPREPLPTAFPDGSPIHTDTTVVVNVLDFATFEQVYSWLASGQHYFRSVIIDSLTELQQRCMDAIVGVNEQAKTQHWGELLRKIDRTVRDYRDLRVNPVKPLDALVIIAGSHMKDGKWRPMLQGAMSGKVGFHFDLLGYLHTQLTAEQQVSRQLVITPYYELYQAKDNTDILSRTYGFSVPNPNITEMLAVLNQGEPV